MLGTKFRKWATQTVKQHVALCGTINQSKVETGPKLLIEVISQWNNTAQKKINHSGCLCKDMINKDFQILIP